MAYNDYDYVVLIDENGQPYIAHGVFRTAMGKAKQGAKYLLKAIDTRTGLPVYAYTEAEVRRLQGMGRAAKEAAGNAARGAAKTAKKAAFKTEWAARGAGADIRRVTGIGGKKRAEELQSRADSTTNRSKSAFEKQAAAARAEYENSILGRLEKTVEKLKQRGRVARDTIRQYGGTTLAEIRRGAGAVASRVGSLATSAGNAIRTGATNVGNAVTSAGNAIKTGAGALASRAGSLATNAGNTITTAGANMQESANNDRALRQARSDYEAAVKAYDNATTKQERNEALKARHKAEMDLEDLGYTPDDFGYKH